MLHPPSGAIDSGLSTKEEVGQTGTVPSGAAAESRLERLVSNSPVGIVETDADGRMSFVNQRWCEMLDYDEAELLGRTVLDITDQDSLQATQDAIASLRAGASQVTLDKSYQRKDGNLLHASSAISAIRDDAGNFMGVLAVIMDNARRLAMEQRLRTSEQRLRQILDNTVAMVGILQPDGTLTEANMPAVAGAGLARSDVIGKKFWDCYWWSDDAQNVERLKAAVEAAAQGEAQRYDAEVRMADDTRVQIDFMLSPVFDEDGAVALLVPSAFDISDRKRSEAKLAYLMREVNHRSKNLLTVVQSMLRQMRPTDMTVFVHDFGERLRALSACQDLLVNATQDYPTLEALILSQLGHFRDVLGVRVRVSGPDVLITPDVAQSLGMAIYELTTNAAKYGALSDANGQISISWGISRPAPDTEPQLALVWQEMGGPEVAQPDKRGFGSVVLEDMLAMALDAKAKIEFSRPGLRWTVTCPLGAVTPDT